MTIQSVTIPNFDGVEQIVGYDHSAPQESCDCSLGAWQPIHTYSWLPSACNQVIAVCNLPCWFLKKIKGEAGREDSKSLG